MGECSDSSGEAMKTCKSLLVGGNANGRAAAAAAVGAVSIFQNVYHARYPIPAPAAACNSLALFLSSAAAAAAADSIFLNVLEQTRCRFTTKKVGVTFVKEFKENMKRYL